MPTAVQHTTSLDSGRDDGGITVVGSARPGPGEIGHAVPSFIPPPVRALPAGAPHGMSKTAATPSGTTERVERPAEGTLARGRYEAQPWMIWCAVIMAVVVAALWFVLTRRRKNPSTPPPPSRAGGSAHLAQ